jgi:hypothetical protein
MHQKRNQNDVYCVAIGMHAVSAFPAPWSRNTAHLRHQGHHPILHSSREQISVTMLGLNLNVQTNLSWPRIKRHPLNTNPPPRVTPCQKLKRKEKTKLSVAKRNMLRSHENMGPHKPNGQLLPRISGRRAFEDSTTCSVTVPGRRDQPSPGSSLWHPLSAYVWFVDHRYGAVKPHRQCSCRAPPLTTVQDPPSAQPS